MSKQVEKYFEYAENRIYFVFANNNFWIAVKPICFILGINYNRQFKNIKKDPVINGIIKLQYFLAADNKNRQMICLPEFTFYYWLLQLRSTKKEMRPVQFDIFTSVYRELNSPLNIANKIFLK